MNIRRVLILVVIAISATGLLGQSGDSSRGEIQELINQIKDGRIERVIVLQATNIVTNTRMVPITLTHEYTQKLDYQIRSQEQKNVLILLLKDLKVNANTRGADVRVGIVFVGPHSFDTREGWSYGISSDEFGEYGYMGRIGKDWQLDGRADRGIRISRDLWSFASRLFTAIDH